MSIKQVASKKNSGKKTDSLTLNVAPMGYRRMTKASIWKHRDYHEYTKHIKDQADEQGFEAKDCLGMDFWIPMPKSWSKKRRKAHDYRPHKQRPDLDNLVKAMLDALFYKKEGGDSKVWTLKAAKYWSEEGRIEIWNT